MGNGLTYCVPRFQRDYSWEQDEWDDLWQDIRETIREGGEQAHYMGYLVLQTRDNKTFDVIDGQQRLTTLSLLVLAVLKGLQDFIDAGIEPENNRRRLDQLRNSYIGYLDPVTLIPRTKLTLNRNNDGYYRDYLVPLEKLPQRGIRGSEHLLRKAFEWFYRQLRENYGPQKNGAELARLIDALADKLFFTVITVTDELNAFKVFETLNARGVRLSPTDLLKNFLFSVVSRENPHDSEIATLERRWEALVGRLGNESFPDFLRVHWNSRRKFVREAELFKTIRAATPDKARAFELLREMEEDIGTYTALSTPEDAQWNRDQQRSVRELRMFSVRQPWSLLLAAARVFDESGLTGLLRACSVISFRYNVIGGLAAGDQERTYNQVALLITERKVTQASDVIRALNPVYIHDDAFRTAFETKVLRTTSARNKHVARYILFALERHLSRNDLEEESASYTLEHILPVNPNECWGHFTDQQADDFAYRLGNLTLLEAGTNRGLGNGGFDTKQAVYQDSLFALTKKIAADNSEWTMERIAGRQRWMANQAVGIWRIAQLS